jgi:hypothetical protein
MVRLLKQAGQGQRQQLGKVFRQEDQSAFGKHVLDGIDHPIVDEVHSQDALVAGIAKFVGKEQTQVERRQLVDVLVVAVFGVPDLGLDGKSPYPKMSI